MGVDFAYQDGAITFYNLLNGHRGNAIRDDKREGARHLGAFVEEQAVIHERYVVTGRLRYDDVSYFYDDHLNPLLDDSKSFSQLSPMVGCTYLIDSRTNVYASVSRGIEAPAGNETDPPSTYGEDTVTALNPLLKLIRSTAVEIGARSIVTPDNSPFSRLLFDAAAYIITIADDIIPYRGGRFYFTAGKT